MGLQYFMSRNAANLTTLVIHSVLIDVNKLECVSRIIPVSDCEVRDAAIEASLSVHSICKKYSYILGPVVESIVGLTTSLSRQFVKFKPTTLSNPVNFVEMNVRIKIQTFFQQK